MNKSITNEEMALLLKDRKVVAVENRQFKNERYHNNVWEVLSLVFDDGSFVALCADDEVEFLHVKEPL